MNGYHRITIVISFAGDSLGQPTGTGVQPPNYPPSGQQPPFPIYVIPYPLPIVPSPGSCPCYLLNPGRNDTTAVSQPQGQAPPSYQGQAPYGIIGFIPVVFLPSCPGNGHDMQMVQQSFPNAVPVPYNCAQCQQNRDISRYLGRLNGGRSADFGDLKEIKSVQELEDLLKKQIKPMKKMLRRISVHPKMLEETSNTENIKH